MFPESRAYVPAQPWLCAFDVHEAVSISWCLCARTRMTGDPTYHEPMLTLPPKVLMMAPPVAARLLVMVENDPSTTRAPEPSTANAPPPAPATFESRSRVSPIVSDASSECTCI